MAKKILCRKAYHKRAMYFDLIFSNPQKPNTNL